MEARVEKGECVVMRAAVECGCLWVTGNVLLPEKSKLTDDRPHDSAAFGHTEYSFQFVFRDKRFRHVSHLPD